MYSISRYHYFHKEDTPRNAYIRHLRLTLVVIVAILALIYTANKPYHQPMNSAERAKQIEELANIVPRSEAEEIMTSVHRWAKKFNVDKKLILAVVKIESGFNKYAISSSGAFGLMQVIPSWHKEKVIRARDTLGDPNLFSVDTNIYIGTWILKDCIKKYVDIYAGLECYSGGTPGYGDKVLKEYNKT